MANLTKPSGFLAPTNLQEALDFANVLAKSNFVPRDFQGNPGNVIVAIQFGYELGLAPLQAMQSISIINGRPSIWGDAMLALVRGSGLLESIKEYQEGDTAYCTIKRKGEEAHTTSFSMQGAFQAGLTKREVWQKYPERMLKLRARAFALRDVFPDVLRGIHIAEEARDIPPEDNPSEPKHMGQVQEVKKPTTRKEVILQALEQHEIPPVTEYVQEAQAMQETQAVQAVESIETAEMTQEFEADLFQQVLQQIQQASTHKELETVAKLATALQDENQLNMARDAYRKKHHALPAEPPQNEQLEAVAED